MRIPCHLTARLPSLPNSLHNLRHLSAPTSARPAGATLDMRMFHAELFGPVTPVYKFSTDDGELKAKN